MPLSGGLDSCTVALVVYNMCHLLYTQMQTPQRDEILGQLRKVLREKDYTPTSAKEMCSKLLFTVYLATENSSEITRARAVRIAEQFGCQHRAVNFDTIYKSYQ